MANFFSKIRGSFFPPERPAWKIVVATLGTLLGVIFILVALVCAYDVFYNGRVYPGVLVSGYELGGLKPAEVKSFIENINNRYTKEGIDLAVTGNDGQQHEATLTTVIAGDSTVELIDIDSDALVKEAMAIGRGGSIWEELFQPLKLRLFAPVDLVAPVDTNSSSLTSVLRSVLNGYEDAPMDATLTFDSNLNPTIVPEKSGLAFDYPVIVKAVEASVAALSFTPVNVSVREFSPTISSSDLAAALPKLSSVLAAGPISLNYVNINTNEPREWVFTQSDFAPWILPQRDDSGQIIFGLNQNKVSNFLAQVVDPVINVAGQDAKFTMDTSTTKVEQFQASQTGVTVNDAKTFADLDTAFRARNYADGQSPKSIPVSVDIVQPKIQTADVNSLGITAIIGTGTSTFHDSHSNRIKNIAIAVKRLNGVLIKPGEEFSALKYAGPFTAANGFLPEQVILGDEITDEIGGGMCQIGTTLFRMAMNSGMDITQRRNHSLVVGYYADPVNGNPGTDATLYEPSLDLKFMNDTGNYLLLQTNIDYTKQILTFTLWGKPDGRSGSYTHPLVSKWIPAGDEEIKYDDSGSVPVGQEQCQGAFRGAEASFMYTRITPAGQTIDREFDSYYRPLPKICVIGVAKGSCAGMTTCAPAPSDTTVSSTTASGAIEGAE